MKAIVLGSGGREHTIAYTLAKSKNITKIICIPGNGGTRVESKCVNNDISLDNKALVIQRVVDEFKSSKEGSFVVVGPEDPLSNGIVDDLQKENILVVGPTQKAAELESSKNYAKEFMNKYGVACAESITCASYEEAIEKVEKLKTPIVIKADGLAAGKGVVIANTKAQAITAIKDFMVSKTLGEAGNKILLEEYLEGDEISILAAVSVTPEFTKKDLSVITPFITARDHKRLLDGAEGPNTGGMGAIAPVSEISDTTIQEFNKTILQPTLNGIISEGFDYRGFIFFGLMLTKDGPKLLEYNVRLGDPETQAILPLLKTDFSALCTSIINGELKNIDLEWKDGFQCATVAVSKGYPGDYDVGHKIEVDSENLDNSNVKIIYAGAKLDSKDELVTSGGRVLALSAFGETLDKARENSYKALNQVSFEGMFYRKDIGLPGAARSVSLE